MSVANPEQKQQAPVLLMVGQGEPLDVPLRAALERFGFAIEYGSIFEFSPEVSRTAPDLVLFVGDACRDRGRAVLDVLTRSMAGSGIPVALLIELEALDKRVLSFRHGAVVVAPRSADAEQIARHVRDLHRELLERAELSPLEVGEATFDELIEIVTRELRSGILSVRRGTGAPTRLVLGAGRPVSETAREMAKPLQPLSRSETLRFEFLKDRGGAAFCLLDLEAERARDLSVFRGLRVLLVDDQSPRCEALGRELRARGAWVATCDLEGAGLERARELDAEVAIIDASALDGAGFEVIQKLRADSRLRWASVLVTRQDALMADDEPGLDLSRLAGRLGPLVQSDLAIRARAEQEVSFDLRLESTGPGRLLRALGVATGPFLVRVVTPEVEVEVDLAEGLVVGAGATRRQTQHEGLVALALLMEARKARVRVERRAHPTRANIMSPVDEALALAARELTPDAPQNRELAKVQVVTTGRRPPFPSASEIGDRTRSGLGLELDSTSDSDSGLAPGAIQSHRVEPKDPTRSAVDELSWLDVPIPNPAPRRPHARKGRELAAAPQPAQTRPASSAGAVGTPAGVIRSRSASAPLRPPSPSPDGGTPGLPLASSLFGRKMAVPPSGASASVPRPVVPKPGDIIPKPVSRSLGEPSKPPLAPHASASAGSAPASTDSRGGPSAPPAGSALSSSPLTAARTGSNAAGLPNSRATAAVAATSPEAPAAAPFAASGTTSATTPTLPLAPSALQPSRSRNGASSDNGGYRSTVPFPPVAPIGSPTFSPLPPIPNTEPGFPDSDFVAGATHEPDTEAIAVLAASDSTDIGLADYEAAHADLENPFAEGPRGYAIKTQPIASPPARDQLELATDSLSVESLSLDTLAGGAPDASLAETVRPPPSVVPTDRAVGERAGPAGPEVFDDPFAEDDATAVGPTFDVLVEPGEPRNASDFPSSNGSLSTPASSNESVRRAPAISVGAPPVASSAPLGPPPSPSFGDAPPSFGAAPPAKGNPEPASPMLGGDPVPSRPSASQSFATSNPDAETTSGLAPYRPIQDENRLPPPQVIKVGATAPSVRIDEPTPRIPSRGSRKRKRPPKIMAAEAPRSRLDRVARPVGYLLVLAGLIAVAATAGRFLVHRTGVRVPVSLPAWLGMPLSGSSPVAPEGGETTEPSRESDTEGPIERAPLATLTSQNATAESGDGESAAVEPASEIEAEEDASESDGESRSGAPESGESAVSGETDGESAVSGETDGESGAPGEPEAAGQSGASGQSEGESAASGASTDSTGTDESEDREAEGSSVGEPAPLAVQATPPRPDEASMGDDGMDDAAPSNEGARFDVMESAGDQNLSDSPEVLSERLVRRARTLPPPEAEEILRRALQLNPHNHYAMVDLAQRLLRRGAAAAALPLMDEAVRRRSRRARYRLLLGDVHAALGNDSAAREQWERAVELDPGQARARARLRQTAE